jgi:hypothetical protein
MNRIKVGCVVEDSFGNIFIVEEIKGDKTFLDNGVNVLEWDLDLDKCDLEILA